ncbi:tape measure protein [Convivina intestini]|uniref:Tape measure domain-containing protein n=2 Tax=Convivina intestini TaxID=1505726 RepID=A0A2U1DFQ2_9LACO|nr:tape measure protein [Convivina intestini]PVY86507.1 tape measure domain-containing protein [Convivina intestini]SDC12880.1 tape measure domain-containing protein [Leuconostocaceae bacterium R-53105]
MADGSITIDFLLNDQTGPQFDKFKQKAADAGAEGYKSAKKPFDEPIVAKLDAQAKKQGIENFKQLLNELPKKQQTELLARAEKGEVIDFTKELRKIPSKVASQVELNDNASPKMRNIQQEAVNTEKKFGTLKEVIQGTFIGNMAFKAFDVGIGLIKGSLDGAISRVDTLNNSTRAYENMGVKAEDAAQANKDLQKAIDGLPTSLDEAVKGQQLLTASMNNDIGGATKVFRAINDSILGFGGNANQVNEAVIQLSQSFSNGKVDAATWNSMINAGMGPALNSLAKIMGKTAGELKDGMSTGKISAKDFQDALVQLDQKGGGGMASLQKIAKDSTGGIQTSMANMKTAFTRVLADMLDGLQKGGLSQGFDMMTKAIKGSSGTMKDFGKQAGKTLGNAFKYIADHQKDLGKLFGAIKDIAGALADGAFSAAKGVIEGIADGFNLLTGNSKSSKDPLKSVADALSAFSKHKETIKVIGGILGGLFVASKVTDFVKALKEMNEVLKITSILSWAVSGPWGLIALAIAAVGLALYEAYKHFKPFREAVDGFAKFAVKAFNSVVDFFKNDWKEILLFIVNPIAGGFALLYKHNTGFKKFVDGLVKDAKKAFSNIGKAIGSGASAVGKFFSGLTKGFVKGWNTFTKFVGNLAKGIGTVLLYGLLLAVGVVVLFGKALLKAFEPVFKPIAKLVTSAFKAISKVISNWFKTTQKAWKAGWKVITDVFTSVWNGLVKFFTPIIKWLGKAIDNEIKGIQKGWDLIWNTITNLFKSIWNGLVKFFKPIIEWFGDVINDTVKVIQKTWDNVWNAISSFFGGIWKWISKTGSDAINGVHDTISSVLDSIGKVWNSMWRSFSDFFGSIWKDIKGFASDGMNGVLDIINAGVDAIDSVWKFFTGHETSIHHLGHVKFASGGTVGGEDGQMAMINDGGGSNWKELLQFPNGELKMSNQRNHVLPLPKGTRVYNGEETKQIMGMAGIQKYANGGVVGGLIDWGKGALNNVSSWIGDKFEAVTSFLKDPLKNVVNMITKATDGMYSGLHNFGDMAHGVWDNLYNPIADWFKKGLEEVKKSMSRSAPGGAGVERWRSQVKDALAATGMPTADWAVEKILRQIQTESGGNEKITQPGADPDGDGSGPAIGLMQTKRSTFNAFALPGHGDIFNGYDNLLSAISYIKARYGEGMSFIGEGHGYANGGRTNGVGIVGEVPGEDEWVTNPNRDSADRTIIGSIRETAAKQPNSFSAKLSKVIDGVKTGMNGVGYQPVVASANNTHTTNGGNVDLSGDVNLTIELDSGQIAQATYPKIKMLQNQDIQLKAQARGSIYGNY